MRQKKGFTMVERAIIAVPEFKQRALKLEQQVELRAQSQNTLQNYIRRIALLDSGVHLLKSFSNESITSDKIIILRLAVSQTRQSARLPPNTQ